MWSGTGPVLPLDSPSKRLMADIRWKLPSPKNFQSRSVFTDSREASGCNLTVHDETLWASLDEMGAPGHLTFCSVTCVVDRKPLLGRNGLSSKQRCQTRVHFICLYVPWVLRACHTKSCGEQGTATSLTHRVATSQRQLNGR